MLGNGKCDSVCNTAECLFDKGDCPCYPGCSYLNFPSCKADCLVPSCHYDSHGVQGGCQDQFILELAWATQSITKNPTAQFDMAACQLSDPLCTPSKLRAPWDNQSCDKDQETICNTEKCVFALGFCVRSLYISCARGFGKDAYSCFKCKPGYVKLYSVCLEYCPVRYEPTSDDFCINKKDTSTLSAPGVIYVADSKIEGDGSLAWPFNSLGLASAAVWQRYTNIYLLGHSVLLSLDLSSTHPEVMALNLLGPTYPEVMRISSLTCDMMSTAHCSTVFTEINVVTPLSLFAYHEVILEHVIITSKRLFAGLTLMYCPQLTFIGEQWMQDNGQVAPEDVVTASTLCEPFSGYSMIIVMDGGSVTFRDVVVSNFALQARALIEIKGGRVTLENVNFIDMQTQRGNAYGGVIVQGVNCVNLNCGSFTFVNGKVRNLNNGLRYAEGLLLTSFLYGVSLSNVLIANVTFEHNMIIDAFSTVTALSSTALIYLNNFYNLIISNCTFSANFVTGGVIVVDSEVVLPKLSNNNNTAYMYSYPHINLTNILFDSNLCECSLVSIHFQRDVLNIDFSGMTLINNAVEGDGMLIIENSRIAKPALAFGETKMLLSATTGKMANLWIPPRHISIANVNIAKTTSAASLVIVENCANVKLSKINIMENGDNDEDVFNKTFSVYAAGLSQDPPLFPDPSACDHFLYFHGNIQLTLQQIILSANLCSQGIWGVYMLSNTGTVSAVDITARNNICTSSIGGALTVLGNTNIYVAKVTAKNNTNVSGGVLNFGTNSQVVLQDSLFQDNFGMDGAVVTCDAVRSLTASQLIFRNSTAMGNAGGGLHILAENYQTVTYKLTNCQFDGNWADIGGGLAVQARNRTAVLFILTSSQFRHNYATVSAAALLLDSGLILKSGSVISDCLFADQISAYGAVVFGQTGGVLDMSNCVFQGNTGLNVATVFIQTEDQALTTFANIQFLGSLGPATLSEINARFNSSFITRNCIFRDNEGADIVMEGGYWQDFNSSFVYSTVSEFQLSSLALIYFSNTSMQNNHADYQGGCIHLLTGAKFNCDRCTFLNNSAGHSGGAIYAEQDSTLTIRHSLFRFNTAVRNGAVLQLVTSTAATSLIESSLIEFNSVSKLGIIFVQSASLILSNVTMRSNEGLDCPGVVLMLSAFQFLNSQFSSHSGFISAFIMGLTNSNVKIVGSSFSNGNTENGGGITISNSVLNIIDTTFDSLQGGAIYANDECEVTLRGVKMTNISLETEGSLIDSLYSTLYISQSDFSHFHDIGIYGFQMREVIIAESSFAEGFGEKGAAFQCYQCVQVLIDKSVFEDLHATYAGAVFLWGELADFQRKFTISNSIFRGNTADAEGGAVAVFNYITLISGSYFEENLADEGAALWLDCIDVEMCSYSVSNSTFLNNSAAVQGGGIAWTTVKPTLANLTFSGNTAQYGPDVASYPIRIVLDSISGRSLSPDLIADYPPGQNTPNSIRASIVDHYGQAHRIDNSSIVTLGATDSSSTVLGTFKVTATQGTFLLDSFKVYGPPGTTQNIALNASGIRADSPGDPDAHISSILITVELRKCIPGEAQTQYSCEVCSEGTFSFDPLTPCQSCLNNAKCWGNLTMTPDAGYWRSNEHSLEVRTCPKPETCLGGVVEGQPLNLIGYCLEGYENNLCQACQLHYSRTGKNICSKCPDTDINVVRLIFVAIALILVLAFMVWSTLRASTRPKAEYSILIKIMTNYLQLVTLVIGFKLRWPQEVEDAFIAQNSVGGASEQFFSVDCLIGTDLSQEQTFYRKMIMMALIPLLLVAVSVGFWSIVAWRKKKWKLLRRECAATIVIIFFLILPNLVDSMFSLFSCQEIEPGEYWLTVDLSIRCWNGTHSLYLLAVGVPGVVVWVLGVPLGCVGVLTKYRKRQDEIWLKLQYGFLLSGYTRRCYYWEFLILYRKVLIIVCAAFINNSIPLQALTIQVVLLFAFFLQQRVQPYVTSQLNMTETLAILVADVTIYCGLYYLTMQLSYGASWILFLLIVTVNIVFVLFWLYTLIRSVLNPITSAVPVLRHIFRPHYFRDKDMEKFLELSGLWHSPAVTSFHFTLTQCMRAMLRTPLPDWFIRPNKRYVPRLTVVSANTTCLLKAKQSPMDDSP